MADHPSFITVTHGMSGFFAVMLTWNEDHGGFYEPYTTGMGRYDHGDAANAEAKQWAVNEGLEYKPAKVGVSWEMQQEIDRKVSERLKLRIARIKQYKEEGMSFDEARTIALREFPYINA